MLIKIGIWLTILVFTIQAKALTPYSTDELDELEKSFIQAINQSNQVDRDPLAVQTINHIGKRLAAFADVPTPYFFIVNANEINAFAGPGGYIGINTALILATDNESELAAVMAHELAHVRLHHLYRLIQHEKQMRIPMLASVLAAAALGMLNPTLGTSALMASLTGFAQNNINFTRANEKEADRIGIDMLIRADFNPDAMASFFKKMQQNARYYYTANIPPILRTHPIDSDRIAEAESRAASLSKKNHVENVDYYLFQALIRQHVMANQKELLDLYKSCMNNNPQPACRYGYALTVLQLNRYNEAYEQLLLLIQTNPTNLFYNTALIKTELALKKSEIALERAEHLYASYPGNYAVLMNYADTLQATNHHDQAAMILIKGFRVFKHDIVLCEALARAEANRGRHAYAYFTQAQCQRLQGQHKDAIRQLKLVQKMTKNDAYLSARAEATIEEIKDFLH